MDYARFLSLSLFAALGAVVLAGAPALADDVGCSDGQREGFVSIMQNPNIAGCSGGWSVAGMRVVAAPACGRRAGDDSANPSGALCNASDLCGAGWHVCETSADVTSRSAAMSGCANSVTGVSDSVFFSSRVSGPGSGTCGVGANDLFGCGNLGDAPYDLAGCSPLTRFSNDLCGSLGAPWSCGTDGFAESDNVTKASPAGGGVLCCRDALVACDCFVGGVCYAEGASNPVDSCQVCRAAGSVSAFSPSAAAGCCASDTDCTGGPLPRCDTATNRCVACQSNLDCGPSLPVCSAAHSCGPCAGDADCAGRPATPQCNTAAGSCVAVPAAPVVVSPANGSTTANTTPTVQGSGPANSTIIVFVDGVRLGTTTSDASGAWSLMPSMSLALGSHTVSARASTGSVTSPSSNTNTFLVVSCVSTADCRGAGVCDGATHLCVGCVTNSDCPSASAPACDLGTRACRPCAPATAVTDCTTTGLSSCAMAAPNAGRCAPPAPVVSAPADGSVTANPLVSFTGTAPAGSTVQVSIDGVLVGSVTADATGHWTYVPATALSSGAHQVSARDVVGSAASDPSATNNFTVAQCLVASDCGAGQVCDAASRTCVGCLTNADCANPAASICDTGSHSCRPCSVATRAADCASATLPVCSSAAPNVGRCVPAAPVVVTPANASTTADSTPAITGTAPPGSTVAVSLDGVQLGNATADASGNWSFVPATPIAAGVHTASAATVAGGVSSDPSNANVFTVVQCLATSDCTGASVCDAGSHVCVGCLSNADCAAAQPVCDASSHACRPCAVATKATDCVDPTRPVCATSGSSVGQCVPPAPVVLDPANNSTTDNPRPALHGTAPAGSTVSVFVDGMLVGTTTADATGNWTLAPTMSLAPGMHTVSATDTVGTAASQSSPSNAFVVVNCLTDAACSGSTPACDTVTHSCVSRAVDGGVDAGDGGRSDAASEGGMDAGDAGASDARAVDGGDASSVSGHLSGAGTCGCAVPGGRSSGSGIAGLALAMAGLLVSRRRGPR